MAQAHEGKDEVNSSDWLHVQLRSEAVLPALADTAPLELNDESRGTRLRTGLAVPGYREV